MKKLLLAVSLAALLLAACAPPPSAPPAPKRYVDKVFTSVSVRRAVTYTTAPDLVTGNPAGQLLDVYTPAGDTATKRPAIVWIHGGGFAAGSRTNLVDEATAYAQRGYVSVSVDYRLDRGNRCQALQDGKIPPANVAAETTRCLTAIDAAQSDSGAAVAWIRTHATELGVDPNRIAVAGFSAGAVTALHLAERQNGAGGPIDPTTHVSVALAASGCNYELDTIDASDAPVSILASETDEWVPFVCSKAVADRSKALGIHTQTLFHLGEGLHAKDLYLKYQAQTDAAWTRFLVQELHL